jgi:phage terminase large subunit
VKIKLELPEWAEPYWQPNQYKVAYGGRNSTKSWTFARMLAFKADQVPETRVLCARETQKSIEESVHTVLADQIKAIGLENRFDILNNEIRHKTNGSRFAYAGLKQHTVANLKSYENFNICWVAEAHKVCKTSWDILEPTIRTPGHEFWIDLNPELDTDETYDRFIINPPEGALVRHVTWRDNPWFTDEENQKRLRTKRRDSIGYENIWEGKPRSAVEGAIYAAEVEQMLREGRVTTIRYDPQLPVHTVWDLGYNDQTVIMLVQRVASELRVIEVLIRRFTTYDDDIAELRLRNYQWGTDWLPHDARHKLKTANGRSAEEIVRGMGRTVQIVGLADVEDGIKLARTTIRRLWVDKDNAKDWLNSIKRYRRHLSSDGKRTGAPVHDDASHGADALRYLSQIAEQLQSTHNPQTSRPMNTSWVT